MRRHAKGGQTRNPYHSRKEKRREDQRRARHRRRKRKRDRERRFHVEPPQRR